MSCIIGHGRYARETYPQPPGSGGGALAGKPLTRQRWIDGNTTTPGSGSEAAPYKTPQTFLSDAALFPTPAASADDANTQIVGLITPAAIDVYGTETWTIPAYRSVTLRALEAMFEETQGASFTAVTINWTNTLAAAGHPSFAAEVQQATLTLDSPFLLDPTITIVDDGTVSGALVLLGKAARGFAIFAGLEGGTINGTGATDLTTVFMGDVFIDETEIATPSAAWIALGSLVDVEPLGVGPHAASITATDCSTGFNGITVVGNATIDQCSDFGSVITSTGGNITVTRTLFSGTPTFTVGSSAAVVLDSSTYDSFLEQNGVIGGGTLRVLPTPGFLAAPTEIAAGATVTMQHGDLNSHDMDMTGATNIVVNLDSTPSHGQRYRAKNKGVGGTPAKINATGGFNIEEFGTQGHYAGANGMSPFGGGSQGEVCEWVFNAHVVEGGVTGAWQISITA